MEVYITSIVEGNMTVHTINGVEYRTRVLNNGGIFYFEMLVNRWILWPFYWRRCWCPYRSITNEDSEYRTVYAYPWNNVIAFTSYENVERAVKEYVAMDYLRGQARKHGFKLSDSITSKLIEDD